MLFSEGPIQGQVPATKCWLGLPMAPRRTQRVELPANVRRVIARGKDYYYFQIGRGTKAEQPRIRLPENPHSPEFWNAYRSVSGQAGGQKDRSFDALIDEYLKSPQFRNCATSTQRNYGRYLAKIRSAWGGHAVADLEPRVVFELLNTYADKAPMANALIRTLSSLLRWGVQKGYRSDNPCREIERLKEGDGWAPWPWEMIELVEKHAPSWMWHAAALAVFTGQRQGDVLAMARSHIRNGLIEVRQEKTGRHLLIPAHQKLLKVLSGMNNNSVQILTNSRGLPWTTGGFRSSWVKALTGPLKVIREKGLVFSTA